MEARASEAESRIFQSSTKEEALKNAILATEIYMKAIKLASTRSERDRLKLKCIEVLARGEEIKRAEVWVGRAGQSERQSDILTKVPVSSRALSPREEVILLEGSKIHGLTFPPWSSEPSDQLFKSTTHENLYVDASEFKFSQSQQRDFAGWRRPQEVFSKPRPSQRNGEAEAEEDPMVARRTIDLVQDVTADCSVVAGLCAAVARSGEDFEKLLCTVFYPYDKIKHRPMISENGKYIFRFNFNGCFRQVVIDDRLPDSSTARTLHVFDRQNPNLLWPTLLEKAYLKVRGGYDFPGSNSGTDLWVLISWIPEQILLQSDEINALELWNRIFTSYGFEDVIITLGTGHLSQSEENGLGLIGDHDYAVLDMKEVNGRRIVRVKNPWCNGTSFRGSSVAPPLEVGRNGRNGPNSDEADQIHSRVPEMSPNTFWIGFEEVLQNFQSLYLNWNPGLFRYRQDHHFSWVVPHGAPPASFINNPQYSIKSTQGGPVWVLLSRHFSTEERNILNNSDRDGLASSPLGFISLYVFDMDGKRVYLSDNAFIRGPFVDSPQTLLRFDVPAMGCYTIVVAQQALPLPKYSFTISAFSRSPVSMGQASNPFPYHNAISGAWTARSAGGNSESSSYASNPQFRLSIKAPSALIIYLETPQAELPIHVKLVWANGKRISSVTTKDILGESGEYRRGCALADLPSVPAGIYTLICSTFEAGVTAKFTLSVESSSPSDLSPIASESAGRLCRTLPPLLFPLHQHRISAAISASRLSRTSITARHVGSAPAPSPLRLMLQRGRGPNRTMLAVSGGGEFGDAPAGVRVSDVDMVPGMDLWLVVERFGGAGGQVMNEEVRVEVFSEAAVEVGPWG